ncbi:SH3 domain-containing protein [Streptomyces sp. BPPL-273]|uniref:SH3 domain-containing protein n=1 Tax=Streptomyces TaxID=1883 RepID=UPI0024AFAE79|nr:SH3 domain-containing protein [Streptomyces sp. BPPL-273]WHM30818.1 SH3 domain-containing protein [Streptomyces sp. BPPL-273]
MPLLSAPSSRAPLARGLATALAAGALAGALAVAPAAATDDRGGADSAAGVPAGVNRGDDWGGGDGGRDQGRYRGVVTTDRLPLRTSPARGSEVIRYARRGETVRIHCKAPGDTVRGNPLWYLLADGTWAWGAARYIDNIGPAPRWC